MKREQELAPLLVSRGALEIFPVAANAQEPLPLLIGTTCLNLLYYELQLLRVRYDTENCTQSPEVFVRYTRQLASYLRHMGILPLLLRRHSGLRNEIELGKIQTVLKELPEVPSTAPAEILLIQEIQKELQTLLQNPSDSTAPRYQQLTVRWMRNQTAVATRTVHEKDVMKLALLQVRRNRSRRLTGEDRRVEWGKEIYDYYQENLSNGYCMQTAKRLARKKFAKAHELPACEEVQKCLPPQPGLHRNSILLYLRTYEGLQKIAERTNIQEEI